MGLAPVAATGAAGAAPRQARAEAHGRRRAVNVRVECYAGYRGEETPRRFFLGERPVGVVEVLDRWLAPDHRYFKVRGDDGAFYVLRHDLDTQSWELTLFKTSERL